MIRKIRAKSNGVAEATPQIRVDAELEAELNLNFRDAAANLDVGRSEHVRIAVRRACQRIRERLIEGIGVG